MSGATVPAIDLSGLVVQTHDADYSADGFHHRHTAGAESIVRIAEAFQSAGWYCEMVTCEDRRAEEQAMRLVYTFNRFGAPEDRKSVV